MSRFGEIEDRVRRRMEILDEAGLRRTLQPPSGADFSSNDYLGLSRHPFLTAAMSEAVLVEGCGATASRLLRGERPGFAQVEREFARFKRTEAALYFGSGFAANLGVLSTFIERHDVVLSDELNHASIVDGIRLSRARRLKFRHCDVDHAARILARVPAGTQKFLVTESLFSMDGDFAPLAAYAELCRATNTALIVDEAHAVGIYGQNGSGCVEHAGIDDAVFLTVNTAGKALGVAGAFVAGHAWAIDFLIQTARPLIFSTASPPAVASALSAALRVVEAEPERRARLFDRVTILRELLLENGLDPGASHSQIIPILLGSNEHACSVAANLRREGFDVRALRPPTVPPGTARLRISLNSELKESTIRDFAAALCSAARKDDKAGVNKTSPVSR